MDTYVYVDGFNLYYGAVKDTPYKWLDPARLCKNLLKPQDKIRKVKYFTARVSARPSGPGQPQRQDVFLRALRTIPALEIIYGHFITKNVSMLQAGLPAGTKRFVNVVKTEEKGSDVNLATHLVNDAHNGVFELAVLITNDSDLLEAVRIVKRELKLCVGLLNPHQHPSRVLKAEADFIKQIRASVLARSQFPPTLTDAHGQFTKPPSWP